MGIVRVRPKYSRQYSAIYVYLLARWIPTALTLIKLVATFSCNIKIKAGQVVLISGNSG